MGGNNRYKDLTRPYFVDVYEGDDWKIVHRETDRVTAEALYHAEIERNPGKVFRWRHQAQVYGRSDRT